MIRPFRLDLDLQRAGANGEEHVVTVLADGFEWQGRRFRSLSAAVRAITGVNWNGWRFFGLDRTGGMK